MAHVGPFFASTTLDRRVAVLACVALTEYTPVHSSPQVQESTRVAVEVATTVPNNLDMPIIHDRAVEVARGSKNASCVPASSQPI